MGLHVLLAQTHDHWSPGMYNYVPVFWVFQFSRFCTGSAIGVCISPDFYTRVWGPGLTTVQFLLIPALVFKWRRRSGTGGLRSIGAAMVLETVLQVIKGLVEPVWDHQLYNRVCPIDCAIPFTADVLVPILTLVQVLAASATLIYLVAKVPGPGWGFTVKVGGVGLAGLVFLQLAKTVVLGI
jgi:hypothetical protein